MAIGDYFSEDPPLIKAVCLWLGRESGDFILSPTHLLDCFRFSEDGSVRCLIALPYLHTLYIIYHWLFVLVEHFPVQTSRIFTSQHHHYLNQKTLHPFLIHIHTLHPSSPIIIPPNVAFFSVFRIHLCAYVCVCVCVLLMRLSAMCDLPLLDCNTSRAGIVFYSFFMVTLSSPAICLSYRKHSVTVHWLETETTKELYVCFTEGHFLNTCTLRIALYWDLENWNWVLGVLLRSVLEQASFLVSWD